MQFEVIVNSMGLLNLIPVFLLLIITLWGAFTSSGRDRILPLLGFLIVLSFAVGQLVVQLTRLLILPLSYWSYWGMYVDFGLMGIYMFLIVLYALIGTFPDFFNARKWIVIVPLIGLIVYEILMYNALAVSFILYGTAWLATALTLVLLFMIVFPLYATFRGTQQDSIRGTPRVKWNWINTLGVLLWAFGLLALFGGWLLGLDVSFFSSLSTTTVSLFTIGWYLMLVSYVFLIRTR